MGTNYYLYDEKPCKCCGHGGEPKHIGKSSAGWCFSLHVMPDNGINDLDDWKELFESGASIKDEYGADIFISEMLDTITNRSWSVRNITVKELRDNNAMRGPNGLLRHKISDGHCIGNGDGTWDLIISDFS